LPVREQSFVSSSGISLVKVEERVRVLLDHRDPQLPAHGLHVVIPDVAERLRIGLESQVGDAPGVDLMNQFRTEFTDRNLTVS
jgi:hypothetical protein